TWSISPTAASGRSSSSVSSRLSAHTHTFSWPLRVPLPGTKSTRRTAGRRRRRFAQTDGVIGVLFSNVLDIVPDVARLVDAIEAEIAQTGPRHIALGSDLFGLPLAPRDLRHMGELPRLTQALVDDGLDDETILPVLGDNLLQVFKQIWQ